MNTKLNNLHEEAWDICYNISQGATVKNTINYFNSMKPYFDNETLTEIFKDVKTIAGNREFYKHHINAINSILNN